MDCARLQCAIQYNTQYNAHGVDPIPRRRAAARARSLTSACLQGGPGAPLCEYPIANQIWRRAGGQIPFETSRQSLTILFDQDTPIVAYTNLIDALAPTPMDYSVFDSPTCTQLTMDYENGSLTPYCTDCFNDLMPIANIYKCTGCGAEYEKEEVEYYDEEY